MISTLRKALHLVRLSMFVLLMAISATAYANATVERINYRGWQDSYRLTLGSRSLVVVPEIGGRIMEYSISGKNVIWENPEQFGRTYPVSGDWYNFGGYKTWLAQKDKYAWPPDTMLDYGKANVEVIKDSSGGSLLRVTGAASIKSGVIFTKDISLDDSGEALVRQSLTNISSHLITYGIWNVTQVNAPCYVVFPIGQKTKLPGGITDLEGIGRKKGQVDIKDGLCITKFTSEGCKIGADTDGTWLLWLKDNLAYIKSFSPMAKSAQYPHSGCSVEVYADPTYPYMEMELLGPIRKLRPGERAELVERWSIIELSQPIGDENSIFAAIKQLREKGFLRLQSVVSTKKGK
ncbi:MAG: DUF4380 domain-containing protein [Armatimonadota bacterium]|nr:DUF4380 domain-containing protein [bacterium]